MNCVDWRDVQSAALELANNHSRFDSFGWHCPPDDAENWTIVYTRHRDSGLLDQSNADAIAAEIEPFMETGDVRPEHHGHWAVGWVDGYAIRVFDNDDEVTEAFQVWCYLQERLGDYSALDESDYSKREYDAAIEAISIEGRCHIRDDAPEDWAGQVFSWLWDHNQRELENRDDQGASPSKEAVREALRELDLLDCFDQVTVGDRIILETQSKSKGEKEYATLAYHASMDLLGREQEKVCLWCDDDILDQYPEADA